ncbi:MAG: helix-turn-helix domain-containing protein, partial [Pseudodesulfovibrio sp.]|uniref:helix-turn-helix domain-containing protein n=1 Tax=Pseudodesulfovibrio sp. TaxID=2035812 RepID=UPI001D41241B
MGFDNEAELSILTVKDVADYLGKSVDWVYDHAEDIGGVKRGGSWFFPSRRDIYDHLFQSRK